MAETVKETIFDEGDIDQPVKDYPWIVFSLNGSEYGVNSKYVLSIEILGEITPIVDAQHHCPGITRSRGNMIELLDLRALFGLGDYLSAKPQEQDERYMMVVIETDDVKRGLIVDQIVSVEHITRFDKGVINTGQSVVTSKYVSQIAMREKMDTPLLIIDPVKLNEN